MRWRSGSRAFRRGRCRCSRARLREGKGPASSDFAAFARAGETRGMVSSVIVSNYNSPDALEAVLLVLTEQHRSDFEVIVADDGSTGDTTTMAEGLQSRLDYRLKRVRQEHRGFRAARAAISPL